MKEATSTSTTGRRETQPRFVIRSWLEEPLSDHNREFRLTALSLAFGLGKEYLTRWAMCEASMGIMLERELLAWVADHPDLGANNPEFQTTHFASINPE